MIAWTWDSAAPDAQCCGVSDREDRAMAAAAAWMRAHHAAAARAEPVRLDVVELAYIPAGRPILAARVGDSITWRPAAL